MKTLKKIAPYIAIIILIFILFRQCNSANDKARSLNSTKDFLNDTISYYTNKLGQEVAEKKAISGDKQALEILLSKQVDSTGQLKALVRKFRTTQAAGNISQETRIDTVEIPYAVTVPYEFDRDFSKQTSNYSISGTSDQNGVTIKNLTIPNTLSFAIGKKKTGFLKSEYRVEAVNSNPLVKTTGLDTYTLDLPNNPLGLSLYVGYGASSNFTLQPSAGIALTYTLFRF